MAGFGSCQWRARSIGRMTRADLVFTRELRRLGEHGSLDRSTLQRIRRGVYAEATEWAASTYLERYRLGLDAAVATRRAEPVLSHVSAAVVWGIPVVGPHLGAVHFAAAGRKHVRSKNGVVWHHDELADADVVEHHGYLLTSFARTALDLARTLPFPAAVAALDHVLAAGRSGEDTVTLDASQLNDRLDLLAGARGVAPARVSIAFARAESGSPGESISRAHMHMLGCPAPLLQVRFRRNDGGTDVSDFDWPEYGAFGEFDGFGKYVKEEYTRGRRIAEVVADEKARENRIRKHRPFGARWDWPTAMRPTLLARELADAGIPVPLARRFR